MINICIVYPIVKKVLKQLASTWPARWFEHAKSHFRKGDTKGNRSNNSNTCCRCYRTDYNRLLTLFNDITRISHLYRWKRRRSRYSCCRCCSFKQNFEPMRISSTNEFNSLVVVVVVVDVVEVVVELVPVPD